MEQTNYELLNKATDEQLAQFLARIYYLNCDHGHARRPDGGCWQCPVGLGCKTAERANNAYAAYVGLRQKFFVNYTEKPSRRRKNNTNSNGYSGTPEKEFRDTIPPTLWQEMTITVGECAKEILAWLRSESSGQLCMKGIFTN